MDIALPDTLLSQFTLWTLFTMSILSKLLYTALRTVACIPIYIVISLTIQIDHPTNEKFSR